MVYEIINPSDPYTIEGDFKVACVAVIILGKGAYGLKGGTEAMPIFLVDDPDEWFRKMFGQSLEDVLKGTPRTDLATCLDSALCCVPAEYEQLSSALSLARLVQGDAAALALREKKHDQRRSSQNDIGRRAWALAERVRGSMP